MKKLLIITSVLFAILAGTVNAKSIYNRDIDVNVFYSALEPYGEWIEVGYDDYVWRPYKSDSYWRPYGEGRWEWTRNGWYWESYEPFGWATYHYGRWYNDDYYGWVWMPDNVWAPAWVEWRYNDNYIGWAPLPPYASFNNRNGIHFSINWNSGYVYWNFVKYNHFGSHDINHHFVKHNYVKDVFNKTKYRTNYFSDDNRIVNGGISRKFVERKMGKRFTTREISRTDNYNEYNSNDRKTRKGIVDYRPSERNLNNKSFDKTKVTKGRTLTALRKDKVEISRNAVEKRNDKDRNDVIKEREIIKKSDSGNITKSEKEIIRNSDSDKRKATEKKILKRESVDRSEKKSSGDVIKYNNRSNSLNKNSSENKSVNKREVIKRSENKVRTESSPTISRKVEKTESKVKDTTEKKRTRS